MVQVISCIYEGRGRDESNLWRQTSNFILHELGKNNIKCAKSRLCRVQYSVMSDSATPWTAVCQASLSITNSRSLPKLKSIESVMPSSQLILCRPLLLPPSIFPSIGVLSNESVLCIGWPMYWSFSFNISPSNDAELWPARADCGPHWGLSPGTVGACGFPWAPPSPAAPFLL